MHINHKFFRGILLGLWLPMFPVQANGKLPKMNADLSQTSLSGISAGGFMAVQFHLAHSGIVKGVGVFAGGPFYCAEGLLTAAVTKCMRPGMGISPPDIRPLVATTYKLAASNRIDALDHLRSSRIFLFSGTRDQIIFQDVMKSLEKYYSQFVEHQNIFFNNDLPAGHGMVTENYGNPCADNRAPFINNCGYDGAGKALGHIYGKLNPPSSPPQGELSAFDQEEFIEGRNRREYGIAKTGYIYIPKACHEKTCRIHVFLHGCQQNADTLKTELIENAGYNRWADTNEIIILYPQNAAFTLLDINLAKSNPNGCWDWWGYSSAAYNDKNAPQIKFIYNMLSRLSSPR